MEPLHVQSAVIIGKLKQRQVDFLHSWAVILNKLLVKLSL